MNQARLTEIAEGVLSSSKDATVNTSYLDNEITKGNIFSAIFSETFAAPGTTYYTLKCAAGTYLLPLSAQCSAGTLTVTLYEDSNYTGGSEISLLNRNRTSANTATSVLKEGSTGANKGTPIAVVVVGVEGRGTFLGGGGGSLAPYIITDDTYLIEVTASEACTANLGIAVGEYS
jgi:hypothetical protein